MTLGVFNQPERPVESPGEGWLDLLFSPVTDGHERPRSPTTGRPARLGPQPRPRATGNAENPMMILGRQVFDVGAWRGADGRSTNSPRRRLAQLLRHALGGRRSNDFMPVIDLVF